MFISDPGSFSMPDPIPGIQTALDPGSGYATLVSFRVFLCIKKMADYIFLNRLWSRQWNKRGDEQRASGGE
jgi:hypothetical protein